MKVIKSLLSLAAIALLTAGSAQAAQVLTITFPSNPQSFTLGPIAQATSFGAGGTVTAVQGYGLISAFTGSTSAQICGGTPCQFTFTYGGFTNTGALGLNNEQLFSGGNLRIYLDATSVSSTAPNAATASQFTGSMPSYTDGILFLDLAGYKTEQSTKLGGNQLAAATTITQSRNTTSPTGPFVTKTTSTTPGYTGSSPTGATQSNSQINTIDVFNDGSLIVYNQTTTSTNSGIQDNVSLALTTTASGAIFGSSYFKVVGGVAAALFDNGSQFQGSDLSATLSFTSNTQCSTFGVSPYYCIAGGGTAAATATPSFINVTTVPEPATLALSGLSLLGLGLIRRRRVLLPKVN